MAVGVPRTDATALIGNDQAGVVKVMYGYPSGLSSVFFSNWWQSKAGVDGDSEDSDYFGESLPGSKWIGIYP